MKLAAASLFPGEKERRKFDPLLLDCRQLFDSALGELKLDEQWFYAAKIRRHPDSVKQSERLIEKQRQLKTLLDRQGFKTIIAGSVRGNYATDGRGKKILVFKEKGVDVHLAVDAVDLAGDKAIGTAVICSSDSDLQPAITKLKRRGVEVIYVGFESLQNRGLTYTCDRTLLFRDAELRKAYDFATKDQPTV